MSSTVSALYSRLTSDGTISGLIGTRMYPGVAPQGAAWPRLTYSVITTRRLQALNGTEADKRTNYQVDCWAETMLGAEALADAVESSLRSWNDVLGTPIIWGVYLDNRESSVVPRAAGKDETYSRVRIEFGVWHN